MDGWNILFPFGMAYFQVRAVGFRVDSQMIHGKCVNGIFTDFFFKEKNVDENLSTIHTIRFVWNFGKRQLSTT